MGCRWGESEGTGSGLRVRFNDKLRLLQGRDPQLGQLAPLVVLPDGLALLGDLHEVDVLRRAAARRCSACRACRDGGALAEATDLVVVGPRGEGAVHRGLEVAALDERDEEEVLVELVDDTGAQLRVPLPCDATTEPRRVVGILGEAPEVAPASKAVRAREALTYLCIDGVLAANVCTGRVRARGVTAFAARWGRFLCSALGTAVRSRRSGRRSGPARWSPSPRRPRRAVA